MIDIIKIIIELSNYRYRRGGKEEGIVDYKSNPSNKEMTEKSFATSVKSYYGLQAACYTHAFQEVYGRLPKVVGIEEWLVMVMVMT